MVCELYLKKVVIALAGEAQVAGLMVTSSIPGQGTCLGCAFGPRSGAYETQPIDVFPSHLCFSPSLSPSLPLSLKINEQNLFQKLLHIFKKLYKLH